MPPSDRARLERLCRYALRPPIAAERLHLTADGQVVLDLRHGWADGTTQLLFEPVELLERLAALTPRPRINLLLYYGVLGARSAWRSRLQAHERDTQITGDHGTSDDESSSRLPVPVPRRTNWLWAQLMQRSFGFDVVACPRCWDRLELVALIQAPAVIRRILSHLGLPTEVPAAPSRAASTATARAIGAVVRRRRRHHTLEEAREYGGTAGTRRSGEVCPLSTRPTRPFDTCMRRRDDPRRAGAIRTVLAAGPGPHNGPSVNHAREDPANRSYRPANRSYRLPHVIGLPDGPSSRQHSVMRTGAAGSRRPCPSKDA